MKEEADSVPSVEVDARVVEEVDLDRSLIADPSTVLALAPDVVLNGDSVRDWEDSTIHSLVIVDLDIVEDSEDLEKEEWRDFIMNVVLISKDSEGVIVDSPRVTSNPQFFVVFPIFR